jgi:membrane associated rhomboid family serine protease
VRNSARPDLGRGGLLEQLDRYPFTLGVLLANALLFAFCAWKSGGLGVDTLILVDLGANDARLLRREPWRLLTSAFLHFDVLHLLLNAWALYSIGRVLEVHFGSARAFALYVACALGGSLCSAGWQLLQGAPAASAGASGGVFGLIFLGWTYARSSPERLGTLAEQLRGWIVTLLVFTGFVLLSRPGLVDHAGHAGGALVGALLGTLVRPRPGADVHPAWTVLAHLLALSCLAAFGAVVWTLRAGGRLPV